MQSAFSPAPWVTPLSPLRSSVQTLSGPVSLNWKTVCTFFASSGFFARCLPIATKTSALVGSDDAAGAAAAGAAAFAGAALGFGCGISL